MGSRWLVGVEGATELLNTGDGLFEDHRAAHDFASFETRMTGATTVVFRLDDDGSYVMEATYRLDEEGEPDGAEPATA